MLGGGLAYRFFFWVLSLSVLGSGGLGFASSSGADISSDAQNAGVSASLAKTIEDAADQSQTGRWWLLLTGLVLFAWFSFGLLRALRLVHAAAWRVRPPPLRNAPRALAVVLAAPVAIAVLTAAAGWVRANAARPVGLIATLGLCLVFGAIWLWVSMKLPAAENVPWTAYVPGAVLLGFGIEALHVFTVYFLETKLANASELYGVLGLATTALFFLFLIGRGVVWAAELNAVVWGVHVARAEDEGQVGGRGRENLPY